MVKIVKVLLVLTLVAFPLGQLTRLPLGLSEINIYLQDILIGLIVIIWLFGHLLTRKTFHRPILIWPILLFFLAAIFSLLVNLFNFAPREVVVASLYLLRWIFYAGIYLVVSELVAFHYLDIPKWKQGLILAGTATAIFGLAQYFLYPDLGNLSYLEWDPHKYRVFGTFFDPSFLGLILVLTIILIVGQKNVEINIRYLLFAICYSALALTYSRSSYLAYLVGMGVIAWVKKSAKLFVAAFLLGALTILLLPRPPDSEGVRLEREASIKARIKNWQESLTIFKDRPILGVGFNTYRYVQRNHGFLNQENWQKSHSGAGADSSLLFVLATTGILGFAVYVYMAYKIYITHRRSLAILASLGAVFVHSWFSNSLFYPWIMLWLWILIGTMEGEQKIPRVYTERSRSARDDFMV